MEEVDKDLIRSNYTSLISDLSERIEMVCNLLYEKMIITSSMKDRVLCNKSRSRQASHLLDLLPSRGARAFRAFYEACKSAGLENVAIILRRGSHVTVNEEQPLPNEWPTKEHFENVKNETLTVRKVNRQTSNVMLQIYETHLNQNFIYPMHHKVRGNALIIVNENFPLTPLNRREGSEWDVEGLMQLFTGLGFLVNVEKNLTKARMDKVIEEEIITDHSQHDCFVFFIMTYGRKGVVLDTKRVPTSLKSIIDRFNEVEDLKKKPKLLFFQACQGDHDDPGHSTNIATTVTEDDIELSRHDGSPTGDVGEAIPHYEDIFVFKSSPDDNRSYRNRMWGSWFTQAIIYIFSEFAYRCELFDLQLKVNELLSKAETQKGKFKNVGEFVFVPGKKFYFFPGLYDS